MVIIHGSTKIEDHNIDFSTLGLRYPIADDMLSNLKNKAFFWSPPPSELPKGLPFIVERTGVSGSLPVYTDFKGGGTKVVTILRKCKGDIGQLKEDMEKVVGREVDVRPGKLVVTGNYNRRLKRWLMGLGF